MNTTIRQTIGDELLPDVELQGGRYRIIRSLGRGGFGITYLAEQVMAKRKVCIKEFFPKGYYKREDTLRISLSSDSFGYMSKMRDKFVKEAQTIARLDHPNIIHIHDVFEENDTAYYVMDYIDGCELSTMIARDGALVESRAVDYIRQVGSALSYIHSQKIMHLDVKPANIMVRKSDNCAILIDFGLSKQYDEGGNQTSSTPIGQTPGFAPAEQSVVGGVKDFSPTTDIYSLGATLYALVTAQMPPLYSELEMGDLPAMPDGVSRECDTAIRSAMQYLRRHRPQSVDEFLALLTPKPTPHHVPVTIPKPEPKPAPRVEPKPVATPKTPKPEPTPVQPPKPEPKPAPRVEPKSVQTPKPVATPKAPTPAPKKSSKVWLWIVLALLLVGCGIGGWLIYDQNQEKARIETEQQRVAEHKALEEAAETRRPPKPEPTTVQPSKPAPRDEPKPVATQVEQPKQVSTPQSEQQRIDNMVAQGLGRDGVYQVGDYYNRYGKQGVVFEVWNGGRNGKIVSLDEAHKQWCTDSQYNKKIATEAKSETDGKANTDMIMRRSDSSEYPAFVWCRNKGNDWYLPAKDELLAIYKAKDKINNTMSNCGGKSINHYDYYWTSTEDSNNDKSRAWGVLVNDGDTIHYELGIYGCVRAVSTF